MNVVNIVTVLSLLCQTYETLRTDRKFLTNEDFRRANEMSDEQIDRGVGIVSTKQEFNPNFYGGDIVKEPKKKRKDIHKYITKSSGRHWTDGRVPYEFTDDFTVDEKRHIAKAIQLLEEKTCIKIVPRNSVDNHYIQFVKKRGCSSQNLGRNKSGPQQLSLGKGCFRVDIIIHEIMHALGFMHEFARPDRDEYIDVNYDNIADRAERQFNKMDGEFFGDWNLPFDIKSAMFYEESAGAKKPGLKVMKAKNGAHLRCLAHECPTELDIQKINTVYECKNKDYVSKNTSVKESEALREFIVRNQSETDNCTALKWKSSHQFEEEKDNPVELQLNGKPFYVCRAVLWNGDVIIGKLDFGCVTTETSGFRWNFVKYDVLINPYNVKINWITAQMPPKNAVYAGKIKDSDFYVMKCIFNNRSKSCISFMYLTC